jgi:hypothetical protein
MEGVSQRSDARDQTGRPFRPPVGRSGLSEELVVAGRAMNMVGSDACPRLVADGMFDARDQGVGACRSSKALRIARHDPPGDPLRFASAELTLAPKI